MAAPDVDDRLSGRRLDDSTADTVVRAGVRRSTPGGNLNPELALANQVGGEIRQGAVDPSPGSPAAVPPAA